MAYDTTYTQATYALANAAFDYESDNTSEPSNDQLWDEPTSNGNAPGWQWTDDTSPSSSTGPPASNGGCVFPESSSPMAANDINMATLVTGNEVDASLYLLYVDIDICTYGNANGDLVVQAFDGTDWNTLHTRVGDATQTFTSITDLDCTSYDNTDFSVRVLVNMASSGNVYQCDFAFQNLRIHGADAGPAISNVEDEVFTVYETNIVCTGTSFGTDTGSADLELGDSATYGSATLVSQSIDTWADTSIQFDLTIGSLTDESLWLYVTDSSAVVSGAYAVTVGLTPSVSDVDTDEAIDSNQTNVVITGDTFLNSQGTGGKVELSDNATYATGTKVEQGIDTWANTSIQFDVDIGAWTTTTPLWLWVTNDKGFRQATGTSLAITYITGPSITDAEDEIFFTNETDVVVTGTDFGATETGSAKIELVDSATYAAGTKVSQNVDTWADTSIQFDITMGGLSTGTLWLYVTDSVGTRSAGYQVQVLNPPITDGFWKSQSIQGAITALGLETTIFLIRDGE